MFISRRRRTYGTFGPGIYNTVPAAPSSLLATRITDIRIGLTWTDNSSNETSFRIERSPDGVGSWVEINSVGANITAYDDTPLSPSTTYYYRVRARNAIGDSAYSNVSSATTFDANAWSYLYSAGISNSTEQDAVNTFIVYLKNIGEFFTLDRLWLCSPSAGEPGVRQCAITGNFLTSVGGYTVGASGITFDGTTGYLVFDAALTAASAYNIDSCQISHWISNFPAGEKADMWGASTDGASPDGTDKGVGMKNGSDNQQACTLHDSGTILNRLGTGNEAGLWVLNTAFGFPDNHFLYNQATELATNTNNPINDTTSELVCIGGFNYAGVPAATSTMTWAGGCYGSEMIDVVAVTLGWQQYQTSLGRGA